MLDQHGRRPSAPWAEAARRTSARTARPKPGAVRAHRAIELAEHRLDAAQQRKQRHRPAPRRPARAARGTGARRHRGATAGPPRTRAPIARPHRERRGDRGDHLQRTAEHVREQFRPDDFVQQSGRAGDEGRGAARAAATTTSDGVARRHATCELRGGGDTTTDGWPTSLRHLHRGTPERNARRRWRRTFSSPDGRRNRARRKLFSAKFSGR